jgi:hypothetical protein
VTFKNGQVLQLPHHDPKIWDHTSWLAGDPVVTCWALSEAAIREYHQAMKDPLGYEGVPPPVPATPEAMINLRASALWEMDSQ